MFDAIRKLNSRVKSFNQPAEMKRILKDGLLQAQIVDLNQQQLYEEGVQADGTPTGEYAPITISYFKPRAAAEGRDGRSDHITGKDTGETYKSMKVESKADGVVITADDRNNFFDRIDEGLGLTTESKIEILPEIKERLIDAIKKKIISKKTVAA